MAFAQLRGVKVIDPEGDLIIEVGTLITGLPSKRSPRYPARIEWTSGWWDMKRFRQMSKMVPSMVTLRMDSHACEW